MDIIAGHDVRGQVGNIGHVIVPDERQVRDRPDGFVDCLDIHAGHGKELDGAGDFHSSIFRIDSYLADMAGHVVEAGLKRSQIHVGHTQDGSGRLHDIGIFDSVGQFRTYQAVAHVGVQHGSERQIPQRGCLRVLDTVDGRTSLATVKCPGSGMFPLHQPYGLHRVTLFLFFCRLFRLALFRLGFSACLFCLPA